MLILLAALAAPAPTLPCSPRDIVASTDGRDGDFDGMSHSGTLLVLRNRGRRSCTVAGLPAATFRDAHGRILSAVRRAPAGMHPGPVVTPVTLAAGASASTALRWVSGPVFDRSRCYDARSIAVTLRGGSVRVPVRAHLCGEAGKLATFDQPALTRGVPAN